MLQIFIHDPLKTKKVTAFVSTVVLLHEIIIVNNVAFFYTDSN
jgi:hypothetical protein